MTNQVFTVGYSGFVNGDGTNVLTGAPAISTTATTNSPTGDYTITISQGTLSAPNYNFAFINGTLTVTQATVTIQSGLSANGKVYDGLLAAGISSNNVVLNGVAGVDAANVKLSTNGYAANFLSAGVGTNIGVTVSGLTLTGSGATNYSLSQPAGLAANIMSAGVTVLSGLSANDKVYDGTTGGGDQFQQRGIERGGGSGRSQREALDQRIRGQLPECGRGHEHRGDGQWIDLNR